MNPAIHIFEDRCIEAAHTLLQTHASDLRRLPVNVDELAAGLGFQVVRLFSVADEFSGLVSPKHNLIGVNGNHHRHRQRFTLAHELGHIVLEHPPESRCSSMQISECNREADLFASELLIPEFFLDELMQRTQSPSILARLFDVSEEAMIRKLRYSSRKRGVT